MRTQSSTVEPRGIGTQPGGSPPAQARSAPVYTVLRLIFVALMAATPLQPLHAQTLNLGGVRPPDLKGNSIISLLTTEMTEQIRAWQDRFNDAGIEADPDRQLALRIMIDCRRLARDLLQTEAAFGGAADAQLLAALTIINELDAIDDLCRRHIALAERAVQVLAIEPADRAAADQQVLRDLARSRAGIDQFFARQATHTKVMPRTAPDLDRTMQEVFGPLCDAASSLGLEPCRSHWPTPAQRVDVDPDDLAADIERFGFNPRATASLLELVGRLRPALQRPAYEMQAREIASLLHETVPEISAEVIAEWIHIEAPATTGDWLASASERLLDPATRPLAQEELQAMRALGRIVDMAMKLEPERQTDMRPVRDAVGSIVQMAQDPAQRDEAMRAIAATERVLLVASQRRTLPTLRDAAREDKRMWRLFEQSYGDIESRMFSALPELVIDVRRLTLPETVSLVSNHREAVDAMGRTLRIKSLIELYEQREDVASKAAALRLSELLSQLEDEMTRSGAQRELRRFEQQYDLFAELPGERRLRAGDPEWQRITGDRSAELVRIIERDRRAWLAAWGEGAGAARESQQLLMRWRLLKLIEVAVICRQSPLATNLNPWSGLELPSRAIDELAGELTGRLDSPIALTLTAQEDQASIEIVELERDSALLRLLAAVMHELQPYPLACDDDASCALSQLSIGPSDGAVLRQHRDRLAALSRWMFEYQRSREGRNPYAREDILKYLNDQAQSVLDVMERGAQWRTPALMP